MQLADRKSDAYWHVFETVVSDCLEEGLVGGLDFTVDVSLRPTPIASSPSPDRIEMLFTRIASDGPLRCGRGQGRYEKVRRPKSDHCPGRRLVPRLSRH